jgi:hypothetical protein
MISFFKRHWPAIVITLTLWAAIGVLLRLEMVQNDGHIIYAYDDAYIHLAIAKNLAEHGVWGITRYGFTSSASSLVWPLLLAAGDRLFGTIEFVPLVLNLLFATALVWTSHLFLRRYLKSPVVIALTLLALLLMIPISSLALTGMEHILHIVMTFVVIFLAIRVVLKEREPGREKLSQDEFLLLLASAGLVMVRFEGLFLLDAICLLLALRRRFGFALLLGIVSLLPVLGFGLISLANGWYFLPNSVLLKGTTPDFSSLAGITGYLVRLLTKALDSKAALLLLIGVFDLLVIHYHRRRTIWTPAGIFATLFVALAVQHFLFAAYDFRYGAYLVATGLLALSLLLAEHLKSLGLRRIHGKAVLDKMILGYLLLVVPLILLPSLHRGYIWGRGIIQASANIYQQQYQMGEFVREFYSDQPVAANDIGTISYLGKARTIDLVGLAHMDCARQRRAKRFDLDYTGRITRAEHVKIAMVYDSWFGTTGGIPHEWSKVGEWKIRNNLVCGGDVVSIYAVDPTEKEKLADHLREFSHRMPKDVVQMGEYMTRLSQR